MQGWCRTSEKFTPNAAKRIFQTLKNNAIIIGSFTVFLGVSTIALLDRDSPIKLETRVQGRWCMKTAEVLEKN